MTARAIRIWPETKLLTDMKYLSVPPITWYCCSTVENRLTQTGSLLIKRQWDRLKTSNRSPVVALRKVKGTQPHAADNRHQFRKTHIYECSLEKVMSYAYNKTFRSFSTMSRMPDSNIVQSGSINLHDGVKWSILDCHLPYREQLDNEKCSSMLVL